MDFIKNYITDLISPSWHWDLVGLNLAMIIGFLVVFSFLITLLTGVSMKDELAEKDNPAFGVTLAFSFVSFFLIMGGASSGDDIISLKKESLLMFEFGLAGMAMLFVSKLIFDNVAMRKFCIQKAIRERNVSAALVDGSNVLATAIIVYTYMMWVKGTDSTALKYVALGWVISQVLLTAMSYVRAWIFKWTEKSTLQDAIIGDNFAVAIRYSCYKISFALAALTASTHYPYELGGEDNFTYALYIVISSILLMAVIKTVIWISKIIVLRRIDFSDEINKQRNTGLAAIEGFLALGIPIAFYALLK